jgi:hypothetical protein
VLKVSRAKLAQAAVAERLMEAPGIVPFDPLSDGRTGCSEIAEVMLPDTLARPGISGPFLRNRYPFHQSVKRIHVTALELFAGFALKCELLF